MAGFQEKLRKGVGDIPEEIGRYLRRKYPAFVTQAHPAPLKDEVPVFMYHAVSADQFSSHLDFLQHNGYQTLCMAEFMDFMAGRFRPSSPAVLLTFDDGEKSLYHAAYPLLKSSGFCAVVFVVPAYIRDEPDPSPGKGWLSWPELREMQASGLVEVESHSYYHARIFTGPRRVDFYHPGFDPSPLGMDIPWTVMDGTFTNSLELGSPIYQYSPDLSGNLRYLDSDAVRQACTETVQAGGGADFFLQPDWRKQLEQVFASIPILRVQYETPFERASQMRDDIQMASQAIEDRLGRPARHLCFPWGAGSDLAVSLARDLGIESATWVISSHRRGNHPGDSPYYIQRLKDDYLLRLPGKNRQGLVDVYRQKLLRRTKTLDIY